ncbi:hypothetical protein [Streptomyces sp. TRM75563]|uniref:hypothetical protein n=1 Tax=Streptomyces sp. TRM75563 TaxID=2817418 RepID=UPI001F60A201|nr:hypothetical protein [Streptomyces sp. TRM75563]MCI4045139.1 hypothetical protein [Streptomyces sp. TRM75563]
MTVFPLDRRTEFQIGGMWTDVSTDVRESEPIVIERGAKNEATRPGPSKCTLKLNNRHGKFSPRNPLSPYFGLIGRNTPIRVSVQGPESYLRLEGITSSYVSTPDAAPLDITGDLDLRVEVTTDWWTVAPQILLGKWDSSIAQRSYMLTLINGRLQLQVTVDGVYGYNVNALLPSLPRRAAVRATIDVDNGAGGWTVTMYWAESLDGPWTPMMDPFSYDADGPIAIFNSTAPLSLAPTAFTATPPWLPVEGRVHRAEVRDGIDGTVVADLDVRNLPEGTTSWTDSAGRTWTLGPDATISDREYRFHGEISAWPSRWDVSGADVWVPIEAAGIRRRLGQGQKALSSTLRRRIPAFAPLAYWPCEDEDGATQAYSPIEGVGPLTVTGFRFGQDSTLAGSSALPAVEGGGRMVGVVPAPPVSSSQWSVHMVYAVDSPPATDGVFLSWRTTGTVRRWRIVQREDHADIQGYNAAGDLIVDQGVVIGDDVFDGWQRFYFWVSQSGGTVTWRLDWYNIGGAAGGIGSTYSGTTGRVSMIETQFGTSITGLKVGHIAVMPVAATAAYTSADHGFSGETAIARMRRLANEESAQIDLTWIDGDTAANTERLGPQSPDTLLSLIQEGADTDGGILYEPADRLGLVYRDRASLYNQPVRLALDYTAPGEVPPPLEPIEDDQRLRNDVTVTRSGGSSGRAVAETGPLSIEPPPDGVGIYDESVTLSLATDDQPARIAQWRLHLGTWDEARYPTITVWLHAAPHLVDAVLGLDIGDRVQISNPPPWLPPGVIDQHMHGYTERLGLYEWALAMNCAPAGPWQVGVVEDPALGRADTDGTELTAAVSSSATSWPVAVTAGPHWITTATHPAEFPFDVTAGGEQATVTAIAGLVEDQFGRTVASGWGSADTGQAWLNEGGAASDYSVASGRGVHLITAAASSRRSSVGVGLVDVDVQVDIQTSALATGAALTGALMARYGDGNNLYLARLSFNTDQTVDVEIRKRVAGTETGLASFRTALTHVAGSSLRLRFQVAGSNLRARAWVPAGAEPPSWQATATDSDLEGAASIGCRSISISGNTNVNPQVRYDNFVVLNPQVMTVTRSVNGIVKGHDAGAPLSLTHPMRAAL